MSGVEALCVNVKKNWEAPMFGSMGAILRGIMDCDGVTFNEQHVVADGAVYLLIYNEIAELT